jgi:hypothetical protein
LRVTVVDKQNNSLITSFDVQVDRFYKGSAPRVVAVVSPGGIYAFSESAVVEVKTPEYEHIIERAEVLLVLRTGADGQPQSVNGTEGEYIISLPSGSIVPVLRKKSLKHLHWASL